MLFFNRRDGAFDDASAWLPVDFSHDFTSGVAAGDYDGDGFEDLVVFVYEEPGLTANGQPALLHNGGNGNRWLKVRTLGTVSNRDGVGARITVRTHEPGHGLSQTREVYAGSSFASMHDRELTFGLGTARRAVIDVEWPSGFRNRLYDVAAGARVLLPEIPCSFDDPSLTPPAYRRCVGKALDALRAAGEVTQAEAAHLLASAQRAYHENR